MTFFIVLRQSFQKGYMENSPIFKIEGATTDKTSKPSTFCLLVDGNFTTDMDVWNLHIFEIKATLPITHHRIAARNNAEIFTINILSLRYIPVLYRSVKLFTFRRIRERATQHAIHHRREPEVESEWRGIWRRDGLAGRPSRNT